MKYAINLPCGRKCGHPRTLSEFARAAEASGWDAVFLEDYIIWQGHNDAPTYDPWVALSAIAVSTTSIRVGTMVTAIARRRPWKLARETVTLDHLSGGRVILGVGVGETEIDGSFSRFGEEGDPRQRAMMVDEALELVDRLWAGRQVSFEGRFYHVREARLLPRPIQKPRIPIWIGGVWPRRGPVQRALRWDGACLFKGTGDGNMTAEDVRQLAALARERPDAGKGFDIVAGHASWQRAKDAGRERANVASLAAAGATWWGLYISPDTDKAMRKIIEDGPPRVD